jgi:hypothetical protein
VKVSAAAAWMPGEHVGVGVEGERDGTVPEPFGDDPWIDAGAQEQRRVRVAEVMEADPRQASLVDETDELVPYPVGVEVATVVPHEHEPVLVAPPPLPQSPVPLLPSEPWSRR